MRKYFTSLIIMACLCVFACSLKDAAVSGVIFEELSAEDAVASAAEQGKLVMIDVFSPT
jgi:hypothetical protein